MHKTGIDTSVTSLEVNSSKDADRSTLNLDPSYNVVLDAWSTLSGVEMYFDCNKCWVHHDYYVHLQPILQWSLVEIIYHLLHKCIVKWLIMNLSCTWDMLGMDVDLKTIRCN